ncbi:hypothetical protein IX51_08825 [uncultured archaeon]|nr:hypothetical protein IX51_08825 [uncultured archaeon]
MRNIIEMLKIEHLAIKKYINNITPENRYETFLGLKDFVFNVHAMTEDMIFFPRMLAYLRMPDDLQESIKRISADHKLLETLALNLIKWKSQGRDDLIDTRIELFFETLLEHNQKEETEIFNREEVYEYPESYEVNSEVWDIVRRYGVARYEKYVGVSDDFLINALKLSTPFVK